MKRIALFTLTALLMAACQTELVDKNEAREPLMGGEEFYATIEAPGNVNADTKVYADENMKVLWNADDRIMIFKKITLPTQYRFTGADGVNAGGFKLVPNPEEDEFVTGNELDYYYAVYPYDAEMTISNVGVLNVTLPERQLYKENSFGIGANTMVSVTTNTSLRFKNAGGYLAFKLYGDNVKVSSITLEGNNHEKLSGAAKIAMEVGGVPAVTMQASATESVTLVCEEPVTIGGSKTDYTEFWFVIPPTTFVQGFTVTVNTDNGGTFSKSVSAKFVVDRNSLKRMSALEVVPTQPQAEAVDLGLPSGIKWASCNVGACKPEEYGDYFAWGETEPYYSSQDPLTWKDGKTGYLWASYQWCNGSYDTLTKYNTDSSYGEVDNKTVLDREDDAARVNWGDKWRMPTDAEWTELHEACTWTWATQNEIAGYEVTSNKNGNSIFLPAAGRRNSTNLRNAGSSGYYWSSSLDTGDSYQAWRMVFSSSSIYMDQYTRGDGFSVRPVYGDLIRVTGVEVSPTSLQLTEGETAQLAATVFPADAAIQTVAWTSSDGSVASVDSNGLVTAIAEGIAIITATTNDGGYTSSCTVTVMASTNATPQAIDLGLPSGIKWASFNVGASKPEEYGGYFAWGETEPYYLAGHSQDNPCSNWEDGKTGYNWASYKFRTSGDTNDTVVFSKYNPNNFDDDGRIYLDPEDDAAYVNWGDTWRIPTRREFEELEGFCTWTETSRNGVRGELVTGSNGNSIFLPAAGYRDNESIYWRTECGLYWFNSIIDAGTLTTSNAACAEGLMFDMDYGPGDYVECAVFSRKFGHSIRPVTE